MRLWLHASGSRTFRSNRRSSPITTCRSGHQTSLPVHRAGNRYGFLFRQGGTGVSACRRRFSGSRALSCNRRIYCGVGANLYRKIVFSEYGRNTGFFRNAHDEFGLLVKSLLGGRRLHRIFLPSIDAAVCPDGLYADRPDVGPEALAYVSERIPKQGHRHVGCSHRHCGSGRLDRP